VIRSPRIGRLNRAKTINPSNFYSFDPVYRICCNSGKSNLHFRPISLGFLHHCRMTGTSHGRRGAHTSVLIQCRRSSCACRAQMPYSETSGELETEACVNHLWDPLWPTTQQHLLVVGPPSSTRCDIVIREAVHA
jgi:hypothetical protein